MPFGDRRKGGLLGGINSSCSGCAHRYKCSLFSFAQHYSSFGFQLLSTLLFNSGINQMFMSLTASPPRFVSVDELMETAKGVTNMALAHEIMVNHAFQVKPAELPEGR